MNSMPVHPYYPQDLVLNNYVANENNLSFIAGRFTAMWVVLLGSTWFLSSVLSPGLGSVNKSIVLWFILCE